MAKYKVNFEVEGEVKDVEKFIKNNVVSCPYIKIKNVKCVRFNEKKLIMYKLEIQMEYNRIITIKADTYNEFQQKLDEFYLFNSDKLK